MTRTIVLTLLLCVCGSAQTASLADDRKKTRVPTTGTFGNDVIAQLAVLNERTMTLQASLNRMESDQLVKLNDKANSLEISVEKMNERDRTRKEDSDSSRWLVSIVIPFLVSALTMAAARYLPPRKQQST